MTRKKILLFLTALLLTYKAFAAVTYIYPHSNLNSSANSNRYTIQLAACRNINNVKNFIRENKLQNKATYFKKNIGGKNFYVLVYGNYHTKSQAHAAISKLPWSMRKLNPMIKPMYARNTRVNIQSQTIPIKTSPVMRQSATSIQIPHTSDYANLIPVEVPYFDLYPSLNMDIFSGTDTTGKLQSLFPFMGDANQAFFGAVEGGYGFVTDDSNDDGWMAGLGLGYRKVVKNEYILGGYLLGNYNKTPQGNDFYVLNPGVENLWRNWDLRANIYIPIGTREWKLGEQWAEDIGKYNNMYFTYHYKYEDRYRVSEQIGTGFDAEIGTTIPELNGLKIYGGGYYFSTDDLGHVGGAEGKLAYKMNDYFTIEARGTYDNYNHGTAIAGLRINLGGIVHKEQDDIGIAGRLLDPIEHSFATFARGYTIPVKENDYRLGSFIKQDNIWFFVPKPMSLTVTANGAAEAGTFENPFQGINPTKMQTIQNYNQANNKTITDLYFAPGNYSLQAFQTNPYTPYNLLLPQNFSMWGRVDSYKQPAAGNARATFSGGLTLNGGNNTLDSIMVMQDPAKKNTAGITIGKNNSRIGNVNLNNVQVGVSGQNEYSTGINVNNSDNINLNNSSIYANSNTSIAFGIKLNNSTLNILNNNMISVYSSFDPSIGIQLNGSNQQLTVKGNNNTINSESNYRNSYGVQMYGNQLQFKISGNNNHIRALSNNSDAPFEEAVGIKMEGNHQLTEIGGNNNTIEATSFGTITNANAFGILIRGENNTLKINGQSNIIKVTDKNAKAFGIRLTYPISPALPEAKNTYLDISHTIFDINGNTGGYGIYAGDNADAIKFLQVKNSVFNVTSSADPYGIYTKGIGANKVKELRDESGNTFGGNIPDNDHKVKDPTLPLLQSSGKNKKSRIPIKNNVRTLAELLTANL